jgi:hypothetical protein
MRGMRRDGITFVATLAILIVILVVVATVAVVLFLPVRTITVDEQRTISAMTEINTINLDSNVDIGTIEISFTDLSPYLVVLSVQGTGKLSMVSNQNPLQVVLTYAIDGETLNAHAAVTLDPVTTGYTFMEMKTSLLISKGVLTNLNAQAKVGDMKLLAQGGALLGNLSIETTTGYATASIGSGAVLKGSVSVETTTGLSTLNWNNVDLRQNSNIWLKTTTGGITANLTQTAPMTGNLSLGAEATAGQITLNLDIRGQNSGRVASQTNVGSIEVVKKTGFTGSNSLLSSSNYADPSAHWSDINLTTSTGTIKLNLSYLAI